MTGTHLCLVKGGKPDRIAGILLAKFDQVREWLNGAVATTRRNRQSVFSLQSEGNRSSDPFGPIINSRFESKMEVRMSSSLHSEAGNALGVSDGVIQG